MKKNLFILLFFSLFTFSLLSLCAESDTDAAGTTSENESPDEKKSDANNSENKESSEDNPVPIPPKEEKSKVIEFRVRQKILAADISTIKPEITQKNEFDRPLDENPVWAELVMTFPEGKALSRFDYELVSEKKIYPCIAVARGNDHYSMKQSDWTIKGLSAEKTYKLLFAVSASELPQEENASVLHLTLNYRILDSKLPKISVPFRILPNGTAFEPAPANEEEARCLRFESKRIEPASPAKS